MLVMQLLALFLSILLCNASPLQRRQRPSPPPAAPTPSPNPSLTRLAGPSGSLSAPSQSAPLSVVSQSGSISPSASQVSVSLSISQSASATASIPSASISPSPSVVPSIQPSTPIVTPDLPPSVVPQSLPLSSVTHFITAVPSESATPGAQTSSNASKSFWENKSAVIAIFVIVGVATLALLGMVFFFLRKRLIRKELESLDEGFFEKFNDNHSDRSDSRTGHNSSGSADLHSQQPMAVRDYNSTNVLAPHHAFSGQSRAPYHHYQDSSNYVRTDERSLDRPGSGESFFGGSATLHRAPRGY